MFTSYNSFTGWLLTTKQVADYSSHLLAQSLKPLLSTSSLVVVDVVVVVVLLLLLLLLFRLFSLSFAGSTVPLFVLSVHLHIF